MGKDNFTFTEEKSKKMVYWGFHTKLSYQNDEISELKDKSRDAGLRSTLKSTYLNHPKVFSNEQSLRNTEI